MFEKFQKSEKTVLLTEEFDLSRSKSCRSHRSLTNKQLALV